jgi:hypothetical protein
MIDRQRDHGDIRPNLDKVKHLRITILGSVALTVE